MSALLLALLFVADFGAKEGNATPLQTFTPSVADKIFARLDKEGKTMSKRFQSLEATVHSLRVELDGMKLHSKSTPSDSTVSSQSTPVALLSGAPMPSSVNFGSFNVIPEDFFAQFYPKGHNGFAGGFGNVLSQTVNGRVAELKKKFPQVHGDAKVPDNHHIKWMNSVPVAKLRQDAAAAIKKFMEKSEQQKYFKDHAQPGDVVVHYRCGDIVQVRKILLLHKHKTPESLSPR
jgi:hypothetical protein